MSRSTLLTLLNELRLHIFPKLKRMKLQLAINFSPFLKSSLPGTSPPLRSHITYFFNDTVSNICQLLADRRCHVVSVTDPHGRYFSVF